jgi:hypothetical protein
MILPIPPDSTYIGLIDTLTLPAQVSMTDPNDTASIYQMFLTYPELIAQMTEVYDAFRRANQRRTLSGCKPVYRIPYISFANVFLGTGESIVYTYEQCVAMNRNMINGRYTASLMTRYLNVATGIANQAKRGARLLGDGKPSACVDCATLPLLQNLEAIQNGNHTDAFKYIARLVRERGTLCNENGQFYNLFCRYNSVEPVNQETPG